MANGGGDWLTKIAQGPSALVLLLVAVVGAPNIAPLLYGTPAATNQSITEKIISISSKIDTLKDNFHQEMKEFRKDVHRLETETIKTNDRTLTAVLQLSTRMDLFDVQLEERKKTDEEQWSVLRELRRFKERALSESRANFKLRNGQ